jgi:putative transposase
MNERVRMIDKGLSLSIFVQCDLLLVSRSVFYYKSKSSSDDTVIANLISAIYRQYPVYGYRRIHAILKCDGHQINRKRVLRLMRLLNLKAIYPGPKTTRRDREHSVFPYLLNDLETVRPHQVWQVDITYLRTDAGFIYLTALIDVFSRYIVGWFLSNTLDSYSCLQAMENALREHEAPNITNSDQGSQFTGQQWIEFLTLMNIKISMSGAGRSNDNAFIERLWRTIKYEFLFLEGARNVADYKRLIPIFVTWYNNERPHQSLKYQTPAEMLKKYNLCI